MLHFVAAGEHRQDSSPTGPRGAGEHCQGGGRWAAFKDHPRRVQTSYFSLSIKRSLSLPRANTHTRLRRNP